MSRPRLRPPQRLLRRRQPRPRVRRASPSRRLRRRRAAAPARDSRALVDDLQVRAGPCDDYPVVGLLANDQEFEVAGIYDHEAWLAIPGTGWVRYSEDSVQLDTDLYGLATVRNEHAVIGPFHPAGTRTGIDSLDRVIIAVLERDRDALRDLLGFQEIACVDSSDGGGPPHCPANIPEGTVVEVLPFTNDSSAWFFRDDVERIVDSIAGSGASSAGLYAIIEFANPDESQTRTKYHLLLGIDSPNEELGGGGGKRLSISTDGEIVSLSRIPPPGTPAAFCCNYRIQRHGWLSARRRRRSSKLLARRYRLTQKAGAASFLLRPLVLPPVIPTT